MSRFPPWAWIAVAVVIGLFLFYRLKGVEPGDRIADPRGYVQKALAATEHGHWWEPYFSNPDYLERIIEESIAREPGGVLPHDSKKLDRIIAKARIRYRTSLLKSEENRDIILASVKARFERPPMKLGGPNDRVAVLDYGHLPADWYFGPKNSINLGRPDTLGRLSRLKQEVFLDALERLQERFPDAPVYQIRYRYFLGTAEHWTIYQIIKDGRLLIQRGALDQKYSEERVPWADLKAGRIDFDSLTWYGLSEGHTSPGLLPVEPAFLPMN
jgi:hypothetical protein